MAVLTEIRLKRGTSYENPYSATIGVRKRPKPKRGTLVIELEELEDNYADSFAIQVFQKLSPRASAQKFPTSDALFQLRVEDNSSGEQLSPRASTQKLPASENFFQLTVEDNSSGELDFAPSDYAYFLETVYAIDSKASSRRAVDFVIEYLDDLLHSAAWYECDALFHRADPSRMSESVMVSFLGITLAAKNKIGARQAFYTRALAEVASRRGHSAAERLLKKYL